MFVDYYELLGITDSATQEEIKLAFKTQALKWHPDRNPNHDTTEIMQLLNEAKLILLDSEARNLYDVQYQKYRKSTKNDFNENTEDNSSFYSERKEKFKYQSQNYSIDDDILLKWILNAKRQAVDLAKQTIIEFRGMSSAGAKAGVKAFGEAIVYQIIIGIIVLIFLALTRTCN